MIISDLNLLSVFLRDGCDGSDAEKTKIFFDKIHLDLNINEKQTPKSCF